MWATGRIVFGLTDSEFWELAPDQWSALHLAHHDKIKVYDALQARISYSVARSIGGTDAKEQDFLLWQEKRRSKGAGLADKWLGFVELYRAGEELKKLSEE